MSKIRILCLDIDGVCNSETFYTKRANGEYGDKPYPLSEFDPKAVVQVNRIIEETGTKLVISSSWRFTEGLRNIMEQVGFSEKCLDFEITPYLGTIRGLEIKKYIEEYPDKHNGEEIETYCIVDDDIDMLYEQKDNFVKTDAYYGGLTKEKADEVIRILNNDGFVQHERINVDTGYQELLSVKNGDDCSSICVFKMKPKEIININNEEVFRTIEITVKELYGYLENRPLPFKMKYDKDGYLQVSVKVKQSTEGNLDIFKKVLTGELFDKPWRYINISYLK